GYAYPVMLALLGVGFFGGFFSVPLYTWLQTTASDEFRAHAIAANNIVNAVFMVAAALLSSVLLAAFNSITLLYLLVAIGNVVLLIYLTWRSPLIWKW
ncbi:MFS transporter, partial [Kingella kingae]|nr:MFS transporter [Kingella kingae]